MREEDKDEIEVRGLSQTFFRPILPSQLWISYRSCAPGKDHGWRHYSAFEDARLMK